MIDGDYLELPYQDVLNISRDACPFITARSVASVSCMKCKFNYGVDKGRQVIFCDFNMEGRFNNHNVIATGYKLENILLKQRIKELEEGLRAIIGTRPAVFANFEDSTVVKMSPFVLIKHVTDLVGAPHVPPS